LALLLAASAVRQNLSLTNQQKGDRIMPTIGVPELAIILVIVIIVFGVGRLGEIGGAVGKGIREFRTATRDLDEVQKADEKAMADDKKAAEEKKTS
jgi:sec-independent protein translocase protein TatA